MKEYQVETIVDTLCTNMLSDKEQLRDISSIGLKTVIGELPPASSGKTCFSLHNSINAVVFHNCFFPPIVLKGHRIHLHVYSYI